MRNSLDKVFTVLELLASKDTSVSLKELVEITGINHSTLSRILSNLVEIGYVHKESYHEFRIDLGLVALGQRALLNYSLPKSVLNLVYKKSQQLKVEGAVAGLVNDEVVHLYHSAHAGMRGSLGLPLTCPIYKTNTGLVMLSKLKTVKEAMSIIRSSIENDPHNTEPVETIIKQFRKRFNFARKHNYSFWLNNPEWNVSFPFNFKNRIFSVSLFSRKPLKNRDKIILECSLLVRKIEEEISKII